MKRFSLMILALTALVLVNCTYLPIPLPQEYKLASEKYVNSQVELAMSEQTSSLIDSIRQETQTLISESIDSILAAQGEIQSLVEENRQLQTELQAAMSDQTATLDSQTKRLAEINKLINDINLVQGELIKNIENVPMVTLLTLQKALATYKPQPLQISRPAPPTEKIPAPAPTAKLRASSKTVVPTPEPEPKAVEPEPVQEAETLDMESTTTPDAPVETTN
ncbi:MAG: hypothetical protein COY19_12405 [Candidatus Marinimicrobia bacterium CG_4_10_14_0_2_um_filter_48_9]|nr:MAG: hypothetical protein COY19_12405 [Candidatus Marinimicrobia bacterium CG_4_10_14_0_2_um_filter_48_9]